MIRFGLCCIFRDEPIRFRQTTAAALGRRPPRTRLEILVDLIQNNAESLRQAIEYCAANGIGAFRINSQILPLRTHPEAGYTMEDLPGGAELIRRFKACGRLARRLNVRLSFHPDQFVLLHSPRADVVEASLRELDYQAEVAGWVGADVINIHGGGAYGDKKSALHRLTQAIRKLPRPVRKRLTLENDDRIYTPADLLPVCEATRTPFAYDVHHHRCLPDGLSIETVTRRALKTWNREPLFHLSSPLNGWKGPHPERHHDFINVDDFPACWRHLELTVDIEAKAKERAVTKLRKQMAGRRPNTKTPT